MSKKKKSIDPIAALHNCTWCGKRITEIFSLGCKAKPGMDLASHEGNIIELLLGQPPRSALAIVPTRDSQAKKEGNDLLFAICSRACGQALKIALQQQFDLMDPTLN